MQLTPPPPPQERKGPQLGLPWVPSLQTQQVGSLGPPAAFRLWGWGPGCCEGEGLGWFAQEPHVLAAPDGTEALSAGTSWLGVRGPEGSPCRGSPPSLSALSWDALWTQGGGRGGSGGTALPGPGAEGCVRGGPSPGGAGARAASRGGSSAPHLLPPGAAPPAPMLHVRVCDSGPFEGRVLWLKSLGNSVGAEDPFPELRGRGTPSSQRGVALAFPGHLFPGKAWGRKVQNHPGGPSAP